MAADVAARHAASAIQLITHSSVPASALSVHILADNDALDEGRQLGLPSMTLERQKMGREPTGRFL
jgi:hypothetical protein